MRAPAIGLVLALVGPACASDVPLEGRVCPCAEDLGYQCCGLTSTCIPAGEACEMPAGRYLPMDPGFRWVYRVIEADGTEATKVQTVFADEEVPPAPGEPGGKRGHRVVSEIQRGAARLVTESWQEDRGTQVVRHHERTFDGTGAKVEEEWWEPYRLRLDEDPDKLIPGKVWTVTFTELRVEPGKPAEPARPGVDRWVVVALADPVTAAGSTFRCLKVQRDRNKTFWFARGVGKVKEITAGGETEVLVSYRPPP